MKLNVSVARSTCVGRREITSVTAVCYRTPLSEPSSDGSRASFLAYRFRGGVSCANQVKFKGIGRGSGPAFAFFVKGGPGCLSAKGSLGEARSGAFLKVKMRLEGGLGALPRRDNDLLGRDVRHVARGVKSRNTRLTGTVDRNLSKLVELQRASHEIRVRDEANLDKNAERSALFPGRSSGP